VSVAATVALVAVGGALGGAARVWVAALVGRMAGEGFPWGTLAVNVTGSAAAGATAALLRTAEGVVGDGVPLGVPVWALAVVGVLGSYTTVSSFALQAQTLARGEGGWRRAAGYVAASLAGCLAAVTAGYGGALALAGG
jgi:fluoride exporter